MLINIIIQLNTKKEQQENNDIDEYHDFKYYKQQ